ncbi:hypothetical protein AAG906_021665 [Vitis piasezkii]
MHSPLRSQSRIIRGLSLTREYEFLHSHPHNHTVCIIRDPLSITHQGKGPSIREASQPPLEKLSPPIVAARGTHRRGNHAPQFGRHLPQQAAARDSIERILTHGHIKTSIHS